MASIYNKGRRLYGRLQDEKGVWFGQPTPYNVGDEDKARRWVKTGQAEIDKRRATGAEGPLTVQQYAVLWAEERRRLGLGTADLSAAQIEKHVLPWIGGVLLAELRPVDVRNMVRELRKAGKLAPRSIRNAYGTLHTMMESAVVEERLAANPCKLKRGELPALRDKDATWRALATYVLDEIERLISDDHIPVERRVMYALKAIAGLRHGEAAATRWRCYDATKEPLGQLLIAEAYDSRKCELKGTKTEVPRRVPVHPALAKILATWKLSHWERIYGRPPTGDDFIVPARTMEPLNVVHASRTIGPDLDLLGLRVEAGEFRGRGGHDLRAWFITALQEAGAHRDLLRVITHTTRADVMSGYTRASWPALCAEVLKLRISAESRGTVLSLATDFATAEKKARNRWGKTVRAEGLEAATKVAQSIKAAPTSEDHDSLKNARSLSRTPTVASLATAIAEAVRAGDQARALELLEALGALPAAPKEAGGAA